MLLGATTHVSGSAASGMQRCADTSAAVFMCLIRAAADLLGQPRQPGAAGALVQMWYHVQLKTWLSQKIAAKIYDLDDHLKPVKDRAESMIRSRASGNLLKFLLQVKPLAIT